MLQVAEPHLNGPGGEIPIILHHAATGRQHVICGQGPAPRGLSIETFAARRHYQWRCRHRSCYNPVIDTRIRSAAIARQSLYLVTPKGHPLGERDEISLRECVDFPCGLLAKGHGVRQLVGRVAADSGVALIPLLEASSIEVLRRFVTSGLGVTFLPKFSVVTELERGEVRTPDR